MTDEKHVKKKRKLNIIKLFIVLMCFFVLALAAGGGTFIYIMTKDMPTWDDKKLQSNVTSTIYDNKGHTIATIHGDEDREPVNLEHIPPKVRDAFLSIEDVRFYEHKGVDFRGISRAVVSNFIGGRRAQGASTITQQLIKNAYLSSEKSYKRKIQEMFLALEMERKYTKDEILEIYLNRIPFGHNSAGIQAASKTFFNKDVAKLNLDEAALLAGLPKAPTKYSPFNNPEGAKQRRNLVLKNMLKYGFITQEEYSKNVAKEIKLTPNKSSKYKHPYFVEYVLDEFSDKEILKPFQDKLFTGGLKIYTTMDEKIQTSTEKIVSNRSNYPSAKKENVTNIKDRPQGAAVIIDQHTGYIKALVGGREHTALRGLNRVRIPRQPGSSFKPIISYGPAVEKGQGSGSIVLDTKETFGGYSPSNLGGKYRGPVTLREGMQRSINMVAIKLLKKVGIKNAHKFANKLGFQLNEKDMKLGIALGDVEATPLQMAAAYGAFENKGIYMEPIAITKIEDHAGNTIYESKPKKIQAMKPATASIMVDMMKTVVTSGTATKARISGWQVAGKTGTTDEGKNIWFVGFTPRLTGSVWMGYDHPTPMSEYGGDKPAAMWSKIMKDALKGYKKETFSKSSVYSASICTISGKKPGLNCPTSVIRSELFAKGHGPAGTCDLHITLEIDPTTGKLATKYCPKKEKKVFVKLPAEWRWKPSADDPDFPIPPKDSCPLHKTANSTVTVKICTDPKHGGKLFLANVGTPDDGGCPVQYVKEKEFLIGQEPKVFCDLPDHKLINNTPDDTNPDTNNVQNSVQSAGPINTLSYQEYIHRKLAYQYVYSNIKIVSYNSSESNGLLAKLQQLFSIVL